MTNILELDRNNRIWRKESVGCWDGTEFDVILCKSGVGWLVDWLDGEQINTHQWLDIVNAHI